MHLASGMEPGGVVDVDSAGDLKVSAAPAVTGRVDACFRDLLGKAHRVSWLEAAQDVPFERLLLRTGNRRWWRWPCRPVELVWREENRVVGHAPQLMARLQDGSGLLDCAGRSGPSARLAGAGTGCGWLPAKERWAESYRLAGPPDPGAGGSNVRWLLPVTRGPSPVRRRAVDAGSGGECVVASPRGRRWRRCVSWGIRSPYGPRSFTHCGAACCGYGWTNRCTSVPSSRSHGRRPKRRDAGRSTGTPQGRGGGVRQSAAGGGGGV
ncbi:hypothetical protein SUDANB178_07860 (plasmid) [Streptomyces sp. enrichment culture]